MKTIWIRVKEDLPYSAHVRDLLVPAFKKAGFAVEMIDKKLPSGSAELCLCLGGDGTLLSTVRLLEAQRFEVPIMGVHTSAGLGFLHTLSAPKKTTDSNAWADSFVHALKNKQYDLSERWGLEAWVGPGKDDDGRGLSKTVKKIWALNDVVISKGPLSRMIYLQVKVGEDTLLHKLRGDGLIVSSATGSTGYSLSAGGPVVYPSLSTMLVTPICPHEVAQRPVLLDGNTVLNIESLEHRNTCYLTFDGQVKVDLDSGESIHIQRAARPLKWVTITSMALGPQNFFERLKSKLGYGRELGNAT